MGVKGLLQCLSKVTQTASMGSFKGTRVAIDASGWLHKGLYAAAEDFVDSGQAHIPSNPTCLTERAAFVTVMNFNTDPFNILCK